MSTSTINTESKDAAKDTPKDASKGVVDGVRVMIGVRTGMMLEIAAAAVVPDASLVPLRASQKVAECEELTHNHVTLIGSYHSAGDIVALASKAASVSVMAFRVDAATKYTECKIAKVALVEEDSSYVRDAWRTWRGDVPVPHAVALLDLKSRRLLTPEVLAFVEAIYVTSGTRGDDKMLELLRTLFFDAGFDMKAFMTEGVMYLRKLQSLVESVTETAVEIKAQVGGKSIAVALVSSPRCIDVLGDALLKRFPSAQVAIVSRPELVLLCYRYSCITRPGGGVSAVEFAKAIAPRLGNDVIAARTGKKTDVGGSGVIAGFMGTASDLEIINRIANE